MLDTKHEGGALIHTTALSCALSCNAPAADDDGKDKSTPRKVFRAVLLEESL
jgi:hypothetical protein